MKLEKYLIKINIFVLKESKGINENKRKKETAPTLYIIPCFPNPLTGVNISYLKKIK